ncbi:hypothetical protein, conserved [Eimeria praecox]|uniref:Diphthine--ammonia ligase n=1 Tax=Eimeria praecox TaxID=51316 RepID=U6H2L0_9EIME|nr:hypothetical protein, conserved [Eimeria praecox]
MEKNAVALVSGGKDSIYAMHCARQLGFNIRAVATLLPRENAVETDSYMYQSVGTSLGAAVAECLGVPHYSANVKGRPINTETLQYTFSADDELYDLQLLLERVTKDHPDIEALTCGAILSEYQRRRLEYICGLVHLLPVCLMWNREQKSLLKNMVDWGLHAVVVKTASMGLTKKHLGRPISDLLPHFLELNRQYDFHVCGEGGEYETVTLDCPLFTRGSIDVSDWQQICHSDDALAPVWLQSPVRWKVVPKHPTASPDGVRAHATLHDLRWLRTKPYEDLIDVAVKDWGVDMSSGEPAATQSHCGKGADLEAGPASDSAFNEGCEYTHRFPTSSLGCILTGDICATCEEGGKVQGNTSSPANRNWVRHVTELTRRWLHDQLQKTLNNGVRARIVETVCQVCCPDIIGLPNDIFKSLGVGPVALTVVVAPLPRGVNVRLRIVLSCPEGLTVSPGLSLKSADDSVLHVHSVNLWVPSCIDGGTEAVHRLGVCASCQGVRCELASESSLTVASLFLRGCDGRLPFTCDFPEKVHCPSLLPARWTPEDYLRHELAFCTALQTVNAFVSMQYTRHLCYTGGANRGFHHDDCEHFIYETELGGAGSTKTQCTDSASRVLEKNDPRFVAPCIVVFVKLEGKEEAKTKSETKLRAVKQLIQSLIARSSAGGDRSLSADEEASQSILIVAETPSLPRQARVLMLPMWDISPRLGDRECSQTCCTGHLRQQGEKYTAAVTVVKRSLTAGTYRGSTVGGGDGSGINSVLAHLSFQQQGSYTGGCTLEDLVGQLYATLTRWLGDYSLQEGVAALRCEDKEAATVQGCKRVLELYVFYCPSYLCSLQTDSESFEASCRQRIEAGCRESATASSEFLPITTFFPVLNLAEGLMEIVAHSVYAYPK